ncbi:thiol reductase thioredoxin [Aphanothece hegewaldii CCALA 016]|uniref:Thioredoxin n=1 Tax=Aphanothece hegewaldii CCALA 016 TaxID=2107694 RepID=A0A2T1LS61_9CHRO|nr:thioredoxin family protein [Aphanothece hegewaldii]PSF32276.1 thiol reductase thioredoxin [Aphanothece hegewaldii CCALA 016]
MSKVLEITDNEFEQEVYRTEQPVLVYFWASWCGPCKLVSPSVSWIADTYSDRLKVVKLEVDPNPESVAKCKVEGVPALRLIKDKEIIESREGAIGKQQLQSLVETFLK